MANCTPKGCIGPEMNLHHQWTLELQLDPNKTGENAKLYEEKELLQSSAKVATTAFANLFSLPSQVLGTIGGAIWGGGAAALAIINREDGRKAFSDSFRSGANGISFVSSTLLFPCTMISYGLSWSAGGVNVLARANILLNATLKKDNINQDNQVINDRNANVEMSPYRGIDLNGDFLAEYLDSDSDSGDSEMLGIEISDSKSATPQPNLQKVKEKTKRANQLDNNLNLPLQVTQDFEEIPLH